MIDVDLAHLAAFHREQGGLATLFVHPNDHPFDSDLVVVGPDKRVTQLLPKTRPPETLARNLVSAALYLLTPDAIGFVPPDKPADWGQDIFPAILAAGGRINAYRSIEYAKDIGTPDRLKKGERDFEAGRVERLSRRQPRPAIFLDRDGVLNIERNGVHRPEDLALAPGAAEAIRAINLAGIPAICVTNQPDVAKGMVSLEMLDLVFARLDSALGEGGAYLDELYFCPHHPERGWPGEVEILKVECDCRKPRPGMLFQAARDHNIDLPRSWMIGDRYADIAAAQAAGARGLLLATGHAGSDAARHDCIPDHVAATLPDAVAYVLEQMA